VATQSPFKRTILFDQQHPGNGRLLRPIGLATTCPVNQSVPFPLFQIPLYLPDTFAKGE